MKDCRDQVRSILANLGIPTELIEKKSLVLCAEADELVIAALGDDGREHRLAPVAAAAWATMSSAARSDAVIIKIASAFRSIDRQAEIVRGKLAQGLAVSAILSASAPPGYSEHHTGRAIDITTHGVAPFALEFEDTPAFAWLTANAARFGFVLSYPPGNPYGYQYEPWHWFYRADSG